MPQTSATRGSAPPRTLLVSLAWGGLALLGGCVGPRPPAPPPSVPESPEPAAPRAPEVSEPTQDASEVAMPEPQAPVEEPGDAVASAAEGAPEDDAVQDGAAMESDVPEASEPEAGDEPGPSSTPRPKRPLRGSLSLRTRNRFTGDDQDHELRSLLVLDWDDPARPRVAAHLLARADIDLDGLDEGPVFQDLSDTYDSSVVAKLYLAYADVALGDPLEADAGRLRVGRQSDPRLPEVVRLDGVAYSSGPRGAHEVELGLYGGVPVHLYESSPHGDAAFGTSLEGRPWEGGRARFDWMHLEDEVLLGTERDDLLGLSLWQTLARRWRLEGELTRLEGDPRDLRLRALYTEPESETLVRLGYYELQETQAFRANELDPFTDELLEYFPFRQATVDVSRGLGEHALVDLGYDIRRVDDAADVGEFNRDWERYRAALTLRDLAVEGLALTLSGDRWNDESRDTGGLGADASWDGGDWRASLGTYYALFKYELLELEEREDVRTYYARVVRDLGKALRLDLTYELEDDDLDVYHTVRLGALWRF